MRTVATSTDVGHLPERGEAWLVDEHGMVRAKFYDGNFIRATPRYPGDENETLEAA